MSIFKKAWVFLHCCNSHEMEDVKWHYHSCETSPEFHGVADIPYAAQNIYIMTTDNVDIPQHEAGIAISPRLALF